MCWGEGSAGGRGEKGWKEDGRKGEGVCEGVREASNGGGKEVCSAQESQGGGFLFFLGLSR